MDIQGTVTYVVLRAAEVRFSKTEQRLVAWLRARGKKKEPRCRGSSKASIKVLLPKRQSFNVARIF